MPKNKTPIRERMYDFDQDMLYTILSQLISNHPELEQQIELIIDPNSVSNPIAFYKKMVTSEIKTHNYDAFPNRGMEGLERCYVKFENLESMGIYGEAWKLASAILFTIFRCEYSTKNYEELEALEMSILDKLSQDKYQSEGLDKIKIAWFKSMLINRYKTKTRQIRFIDKFDCERDKELIKSVLKILNN